MADPAGEQRRHAATRAPAGARPSASADQPDTGATAGPPPGSGPRGPRRVLRWLLPAVLILIWLAIGGGLGPLSGKTSEVQKNDNSAFLPRSAEATEVADLYQRFSPQQATPALVVYLRPGGLTPADQQQIAGDLRAISEHFGDQLAAAPVGPIPSQDGQAAQVIVQFAGTDADALKADVAWTRQLIQRTPGLQAHVTGPGGLLADLIDSFAGIDGVLLLVTGAIVLFILILVYRSPLLPFLVLGTALFALSAANGVVYLLAKHDVITLNGQSQGILDVLVLGAATDYALLLVARYREELRRYPGRFQAIWVAWKAAAEPIIASGGTVIIALLCLLISDLSSNRGLGPVGAIGIACAMLAMLTLLPAILALVGRAAFWPFRPHHDSHPSEQHGAWAKLARLIGRRYRLIWPLTALVLVLLALGLFRLNANGLPQNDQFTKTVDATTGQRVIGEHFPAGSGSPAQIIFNADRYQQVAAAVQTVPGVAGAAPFTGQPAGAPGGQPKVVDGLALINATLTAEPDTPESYQVIRDLRAAVHAVPGAQAKVGGFTAINLDVQDTARRDRSVIIPIVLAVVFVILALLLRSLVAPLVLVLTVVLSFLATLGVCGFVFRDLFGFAGADSGFPLFAFVFLVALGVDYNIFLMTRVREETARRGHRDGVLVALAVTGGVITSAGAVLAATFAALGVIPLVFLAEIAFAVAFGVLLDTMVVRSLLVPAAMLQIGRRAWWPGRPARPDGVPPRPGGAPS